MSNIKSLRTLSTKDLGFTAKEIRKLVEGKGNEKVFIARIGGVAKEMFTGESKHGEFIGFKGLFFAVNRNNERFTSEAAFFPKNLQDKLAAGFGPGVLEIEVPAADICVVESEKNASGYAYMCNFTMDDNAIKKADAIANNIFNSKLPLIENKSATKSKAA